MLSRISQYRARQAAAMGVLPWPCLDAWSRTLPLSGGPQEKTPGRTQKACAVGRQLQWVVRRGWGRDPVPSRLLMMLDLSDAGTCPEHALFCLVMRRHAPSPRRGKGVQGTPQSLRGLLVCL